MTTDPIDLTTRHGFLAALHRELQPSTYLEIGVQHGYSLDLAHAAQTAIGIDPHPLVGPKGNQVIFPVTSDVYFERLSVESDRPLIDLAFIDGMHLVEFAWRDFLNIEKYCHPGSVVVFDDVLPRNLHEARRLPVGEEIVGDWTGDVWKVHPLLLAHRPGLTARLVDVFPTGILVVTGFPDSGELANAEDWQRSHLITTAINAEGVPPAVLARTAALTPLVALQQLKTELAERQ